MQTESIVVEGVLPATPEEIFDAWIDGERHGAMTGGAATSEAVVGGRFTAWDYIEGRHLVLERPSRIVQSWRSKDFPKDAPDSRLTVLLTPIEEGTRITLHHEQFPPGQGADLHQGWNHYYLEPMLRYFGKGK